MPAEPASGPVIAELAGELDRICSRRDALAAEIEEAFASHPSAELLATMPGIGPRTGARILAETGDGSRYASGSKRAAHVGLAPVTASSASPWPPDPQPPRQPPPQERDTPARPDPAQSRGGLHRAAIISRHRGFLIWR